MHIYPLEELSLGGVSFGSTIFFPFAAQGAKRSSTIYGSCFLKPEDEINLHRRVAVPSVNMFRKQNTE